MAQPTIKSPNNNFHFKEYFMSVIIPIIIEYVNEITQDIIRDDLNGALITDEGDALIDDNGNVIIFEWVVK